MGIGTGIFLGLVFVGLIFLYINTRGEWNWQKISKRMLIGFGVLVILILLGIIWFIAEQKWRERPRVVTSLKGITLGEKFSDVVFRLGQFEKLKSDKNKKRKHRDRDYKLKKERIVISVRDENINSITYICNDDENYEYTEILSISCYDLGDKIKKKFSNKIRVQCSKNTDKTAPLFRTYDVVEYGVRYYLFRNKVFRFLIADKKELESYANINWGECK